MKKFIVFILLLSITTFLYSDDNCKEKYLSLLKEYKKLKNEFDRLKTAYDDSYSIGATEYKKMQATISELYDIRSKLTNENNDLKDELKKKDEEITNLKKELLAALKLAKSYKEEIIKLKEDLAKEKEEHSKDLNDNVLIIDKSLKIMEDLEKEKNQNNFNLGFFTGFGYPIYVNLGLISRLKIVDKFFAELNLGACYYNKLDFYGNLQFNYFIW